MTYNDLYRHIAQNQADIAMHTTKRRICGLLIGASFSLWRAVFLVRGEDRQWKDIFTAGQNFLEKRIETNAIAFSDEYNDKNRTWVAGYYLNNARFRAETSIEELIEAEQGTIPQLDRASLQNILAKLKVGISEENRPLKDVWDEAYDAVKVVFCYVRSTE